MTYTDEELLARVEYASDLIDTLVTLAADMERHAVDEWDESDFIIQVADTLRALITYRERLEKAESALHDEVKRLRFERDALRAHPYLPAEEIAAIERGNRRWHGEYDTTVSVRWEPYKPDGQRQMKAKGRWQTMTYNGSGYFRWENCNRPAHVREALKGQTSE